ncbi:MAG TPA: hypothetical protein VHF27_12765 [Acidimicrobiales bacterium]|nr:hypothetical protein [Acidimicrobiales bacterium]
MADNEVVWPWGMSDRDAGPASRPWVFNPRGFLVAVLADNEEAERAAVALGRAGFPEGHRRIYPGDQVVDERRRFVAQQGPGRRLVEKLTIENDVVEMFLDYAENGRSFLWIRVPQREDANRAIRALVGHRVLHYRYYGDNSVEDIHVS